MPVYLNELAPWESKNVYFQHIQLGEDITTLIKIIKKQTKELMSYKLVKANEIVASQDRIIEGIKDFSLKNDDIRKGINAIQSSFEWGISDVVWIIEQNRKELIDLLITLRTHLDTKEKRRRKIADKAYAKGWIDDAEEEYLGSEKLNRYDFAIHISLGMIYLFHKIDKNKSLEYFEKAIKYASPVSKFYTSYSLLYKALILRDMGKLESAKECTEKACKLSIDFSIAIYQHSLICALLKDAETSISMLSKAIELDPLYCLNAVNEKGFENIKQEFKDFLNSLRGKEGKRAKESINQLRNQHEKLKEKNKRFKRLGIIERCSPISIKKKLDNIKILIQRDSFFDYYIANSMIEIEKVKLKIEDLSLKANKIVWRQNSFLNGREGKIK